MPSSSMPFPGLTLPPFVQSPLPSHFHLHSPFSYPLLTFLNSLLHTDNPFPCLVPSPFLYTQLCYFSSLKLVCLLFLKKEQSLSVSPSLLYSNFCCCLSTARREEHWKGLEIVVGNFPLPQLPHASFTVTGFATVMSEHSKCPFWRDTVASFLRVPMVWQV